MLTLAGGQKIESVVAKLSYVLLKKTYMQALLSIRALKINSRGF
jgi:hypothetical protein